MRRPAEQVSPSTLKLKRLGIDTYQEHVVYMRADCHVCRSEGFEAQARVQIHLNGLSTIATLDIVTTDLLGDGEASLSEVAWKFLDAKEGDEIRISHPLPVESLSFVRGKVHGRSLDESAFRSIIGDVVAGRYSDVHLAALVTALGENMTRNEIIGLTRAMIYAGDQVDWGRTPVVDKHCVGGLPGNRTTPIVVAIVTACGLTMPKTSSRAITSPAGTADTMETLAPVALDLDQMRAVVEKEGGCIVWGGAVHLSPADDLLIRVERALDLDSHGQLVASVLSKKAAAGSTHVVLDIPVGPTAKVRSFRAAQRLSEDLAAVGQAVGLATRVEITDGNQPVGRGVGPALEARDVLAVLQNDPRAPGDLRERSLDLAAAVLELGGAVAEGQGVVRAREVLDSGGAWRKFQAICEAQGGMREPRRAEHTRPVLASYSGHVALFDNRTLARVAKLAGAPQAKAAGISLNVELGSFVEPGQPLFTIHAETPGELAYAMDYVDGRTDIVIVEEIS